MAKPRFESLTGHVLLQQAESMRTTLNQARSGQASNRYFEQLAQRLVRQGAAIRDECVRLAETERGLRPDTKATVIDLIQEASAELNHRYPHESGVIQVQIETISRLETGPVAKRNTPVGVLDVELSSE